MKAIFFVPCLLIFTLIPAPAKPGEPNDEMGSALIEACKAGDYDQALGLANKLAISGLDQAGVEMALHQAAHLIAQANEFERAAAIYRLLIGTFPESKDLERTHTELAACLYQARKLAECQELVRTNLKLYPKSQW